MLYNFSIILSYSRYPLQSFLFLKKKQKRISTAIGANTK